MTREKRLTREQARELYDDLKQSMEKAMGGNPFPHLDKSAPPADSKIAKEIADSIRQGLRGKSAPTPLQVTAKTRNPYQAAGRRPDPAAPRGPSTPQSSARHHVMALVCLIGCGCTKLTLDVLEGMGVGTVQPAQAAMAAAAPATLIGPHWSKEDAKLLTMLDGRRVELEERRTRLDDRESELGQRDREVATKLIELKELTDRLRGEREKSDRQKNAQLDQLANVYGSMNPPEAAQLLDQLDVTVALSLVQRMPEKRIGQILALMRADRALEITNLLSRSGRR
jgi:flagellar motility protein MotE (MotC chaperone)